MVGRLTIGIALLMQAAAQNRETAATPPNISVPFVGCKSDGQVGPIDEPAGTTVTVAIGPKDASDLAYYKAEQLIGVLAPRGWHCFGTYGSAGATLYVTQATIDTNAFLRATGQVAEPVIQVSGRTGETSGRFSVAEMIARVFPAYKEFVTGVIKDFEQPPGSYQFGPYPADALRYKSDVLVEYHTPARSEGLGIHFGLEKNDSPIDGVAMLVGPRAAPDLMFLAVRLPSPQSRLKPVVVAQFERDVARLPVN